MKRYQQVLTRYSTFFILFGLVVLFSFVSGRFLTVSNLLNIVQQSATLGLVAIGVTFAIIMGGIDLSGGSLVALTGALVAGLMTRNGLPPAAAVLITIAAGAALGAFNGLVIVKGKLQPFVQTLAMLAIARGLTLLYTQGRPISGLDPSFTFLGSRVGPIPVAAIVFFGVAAIAHIVLKYTPFGAHIYAIGGNEETARLAGIRVQTIKTTVYAVSGAAAAIGGIVLTARLWSAQPQAATGLELQAIAAVILGGTSLFGGEGSISGTVAGALIIGVLSNGLNLAGVSSYMQQVITGSIFIAAVVLDLWTKRRAQLQGTENPADT
ncbi:MAG: ABC transporter permease [Spirochaetales bacterium]